MGYPIWEGRSKTHPYSVRAPTCRRHPFETLYKLNDINSKLFNTSCIVEKELINQLIDQRNMLSTSKISKMISEMNETSPNIIYDAITNDAFKYSISKFLDDSVNTASSVKGMDLRTIQYYSDINALVLGVLRVGSMVRCVESRNSENHDSSFGGFNIETIRRKPLVIVQSIITASR